MGTEDTTTATTAEPKFDLSSVNVDSLKNILHTLANAFPFVDEGAKNAMKARIDTVHLSGDPDAEVTVASKDDEIAALRAQLAEAEAKAAQGNQ